MIDMHDLRCEYKRNPMGIDVLRPRLSWKLSSAQRDAMQSAYLVQVALSSEDLFNERALVWDSGKQTTDQSIHIEYRGPSLQSRQRYHWRVRVWDESGQTSAWSEEAFWEMGLLHAQDWKATMIQPDLKEDPSRSEPCPLLRKEFALKNGITKARLYITAHGLYEAWINGKRVGDELFTPGWTTYHKCLQYQTYDVTELLQQGANAIGVILGDGWYRGYVSYLYERNIYGHKLALYMQLELTYRDGSTALVLSNDTWKASTGPLRAADLFNGELYDARLEKSGWHMTGFPDAAWGTVKPVRFDPGIFVAPRGVPVKRIEELRPLAILRTPAGETVIDFGQNMVGWIRLKAQGLKGAKITLQHGEVLDRAGNFYHKNLRQAKATDTFILKGDEAQEVYEPRFTYHGFRYAKIEGYPGELTPDCVTGVVIHSELDRTGEFSCSHPLVNQLYRNIVWTQKGNFLDVPTDCPQRDERMGWTGDLQVYAPTACFSMAAAPFLTRWLHDLKDDQHKNGGVPMVIPDPFCNRWDTFKRVVRHRLHPVAGEEKSIFDEFFALFQLNYSAGWGDAAILVPWCLYRFYGDRRILEEQYASMQALFRFHARRARRAGGFILVNPRQWFDKATWEHLRVFYTAGWHFGDWLAPGDHMNKSILKSKFYIPTVYFALDARILARVATILGREDDAAYYRAMYDKIKAAFQHFRVGKDGRIWPHRQSAYVLALVADLLSEEGKAQAAGILADMVRANGYRLGTGFLGTPYICQVLCEYGYDDVAYGLLLNEDQQWLYQVKRGATTIWEHWDAIRQDGSFQSERMLSFNHYAYGSIGAWLFQVVAGINADEHKPGYKHIIIKPQPGGGLSHAKAAYDSMHGLIESAWSLSGNRLTLWVCIPANARATVIIPAQYCSSITEGGHPVALRDGEVHIGSGHYEFDCSG